jgi:hypothetical protein
MRFRNMECYGIAQKSRQDELYLPYYSVAEESTVQ